MYRNSEFNRFIWRNNTCGRKSNSYVCIMNFKWNLNIILIFWSSRHQLCFSYDGQSWRGVSEPQYVYDFDAANMALYDGKPVMIGAMDYTGSPPSQWRNNVSYFETFDPESGEWSDLNRNTFFPEWTRSYWEGTSVTKDDSFLIFGGILDVYTEKSS